MSAQHTLTVTNDTWSLTLSYGSGAAALWSGALSLTNAQKEQFFANLGFTAYADLTAVNVAFATIGNIYYDRALGRLHINTA